MPEAAPVISASASGSDFRASVEKETFRLVNQYREDHQMAPLAWSELAPNVDPQAFNVSTLPRRLASLKKDPWRELANTRQSITAKMLERIKP